MPVRHQLSPLLECGRTIGIETAQSALRASWGPPQTPPHRQPWSLSLLPFLSSVFSDERRAKKGRGSEGSQGGPGERAEAMQKCELMVLIASDLDVQAAALPKAQGSGSAVWRKPWGSLQVSPASCLCFSHGFPLELSRDNVRRPHLLHACTQAWRGH